MRILYLSQLLPLPLDAGPKVRAYYVLRYLVEAGHRVTVVCFARTTDRQADVDALRRLGVAVETVPIQRSRARDVWDAAVSSMSTVPFLIRRDQRSEMTARVAAVARRGRFDAVHADQLWMAPYAVACPEVPCRVLDQHNAVFRVPQRLAEGSANPVARALLRVEARKLERFERRAVAEFDRIVWVSEADRDAVGSASCSRGARQSVIPIAVDANGRAPLARPAPFRVTFVGGLHWPPNSEGVRWFLCHSWPAIADAVPEAVFTVVGQGGERAVRGRLGPRVDVMGYVPDLAPVLAETAVLVVPLLTGAGMRVKILEAWCWGLPVVSTTRGAEGIDGADGQAFVLADAPSDFTAAVIRVLRDRAWARALAAGGCETVKARYDWSQVYRAWDEVYPQ
jgi:glycosyltransferase involved in cell wall biosynthesis